MAKKRKNNGFERQGAIMAQFKRDARSISKNSSVAIALRGREERLARQTAYEAAQQVEAQIVPSYKFIIKVGSSTPRLGSIINLEKLDTTAGLSRNSANFSVKSFAPKSNAICLFISDLLIPSPSEPQNLGIMLEA